MEELNMEKSIKLMIRMNEGILDKSIEIKGITPIEEAGIFEFLASEAINKIKIKFGVKQDKAK